LGDACYHRGLLYSSARLRARSLAFRLFYAGFRSGYDFSIRSLVTVVFRVGSLLCPGLCSPMLFLAPRTIWHAPIGRQLCLCVISSCSTPLLGWCGVRNADLPHVRSRFGLVSWGDYIMICQAEQVAKIGMSRGVAGRSVWSGVWYF